MTATLIPVCAWCDHAMVNHEPVGEPLPRDDSAPYTHGICRPCLEVVMADVQAPLDGGAYSDGSQRLPVLVPEATDILDRAIAEHKPSYVFALFSGGHDSVCSTHLAAQHAAFSGVVHINTGIGIEETREYVRETCHRFGWPLLEYCAPEGLYEQRCLTYGMPGGPKHHAITYEFLKQRQLDRLIREHRTRRGERFVLVTGIRRQESARRMRVHPDPIRRERALVWTNPILSWSAIDVTRYMAEQAIPRNPVVEHLHRSGECLCGALADPRELDWIALWYPDVVARIRRLEQQCFERGLPWRWGRERVQVPDPRQRWLPLCQDCTTRWQPHEQSA